MVTSVRFDDVMEQLAGRVYTLARYSLASVADAEDVTQEVFTRLWEHWAWIDVDRVEGWLIRATTNACIDFRRRRAARRAHEARSRGPAPLPGPFALVASAELSARVASEIARLAEPFRAILILREIEGLSYQEIGDALALSMTQVKVYLHRARARLAAQLAPLRDQIAPAAPSAPGTAHAHP